MANFVLVHGACVKAPKFRDGAWLPNSTIVELKTGHDPMIAP